MLSVINASIYLAPFTCPFLGSRFRSAITIYLFSKEIQCSGGEVDSGTPFSNSSGCQILYSSELSILSALTNCFAISGIMSPTKLFIACKVAFPIVSTAHSDSQFSSRYLFFRSAKSKPMSCSTSLRTETDVGRSIKEVKESCSLPSLTSRRKKGKVKAPSSALASPRRADNCIFSRRCKTLKIVYS